MSIIERLFVPWFLPCTIDPYVSIISPDGKLPGGTRDLKSVRQGLSFAELHWQMMEGWKDLAACTKWSIPRTSAHRKVTSIWPAAKSIVVVDALDFLPRLVAPLVGDG